jgi:hypothetical protein
MGIFPGRGFRCTFPARLLGGPFRCKLRFLFSPVWASRRWTRIIRSVVTCDVSHRALPLRVSFLASPLRISSSMASFLGQGLLLDRSVGMEQARGSFPGLYIRGLPASSPSSQLVCHLLAFLYPQSSTLHSHDNHQSRLTYHYPISSVTRRRNGRKRSREGKQEAREAYGPVDR